MLLKEDFTITSGNLTKKDGTKTPIAIIDPAQSDSVYEFRDVLKNQFGAVFFNSIKAWGWFTADRSVYEEKIKPCLEWLKLHGKGNDKSNVKTEVAGIIDKLIASLDGAQADIVSSTRTELGKNEVLDRLKTYKDELVSAFSDEAFKAMLAPVMKFRNAQGHRFSFHNALIIWIQDHEATLVKSRTNWEKLNRRVKPDAPALWAYVPVNLGKAKPMSQDEKDAIIARFLRHANKESEDELTPGQKEELRIQLKGKSDNVTFQMKPAFYDVRFTEQMEGKEDLVGSMDTDLPWYTEGGDETDKSTKLINALNDVIKESGVSLRYSDNLGGARGVSMSGQIEVLKDAKKNEGLLNTMIHEFAHEMLHQDYLHSNNPELSNYFVGKKEGREKVEQQAELTAWIVMKEFGYNMTTNINYVGLWGMDERNAPKVFDSVAKTACKITDMMNAKLKQSTNESRKRLTEAMITGEQLADMVGCGDAYRRGLEKEKEVTEAKQTIKEGFQDMFRRMALVESNTKKRDLL